MDEYVETAEMLKTHIKDNITQGEDEQTYESMSRDILMKYSLNPGCDEDIYECMVELNTDSMEDIYEDIEKQPESSRDIPDPFFEQESMLRKFLEGKSSTSFDSTEEGEQEEEDPYKLCIDEDVYDTVEPGAIHPPEIINRPPAPIPRPSVSQEPQEPYISKVFSAREEAKLENLYAAVEPMSGLVRPVRDRSSATTYDPYGGMKTPGQRQLIALQEKVKVGIFTVEEAVQQFKEWQLNQKSRGESFKFQEENLRKLRDSITRRQKEKSKTGKPLDLQITAPIRQFQGPPMKLECAVYESNARVLAAPPPPSQPINRGKWQTGSTTSTSRQCRQLQEPQPPASCSKETTGAPPTSSASPDPCKPLCFESTSSAPPALVLSEDEKEISEDHTWPSPQVEVRGQAVSVPSVVAPFKSEREQQEAFTWNKSMDTFCSRNETVLQKEKIKKCSSAPDTTRTMAQFRTLQKEELVVEVLKPAVLGTCEMFLPSGTSTPLPQLLKYNCVDSGKVQKKKLFVYGGEYCCMALRYFERTWTLQRQRRANELQEVKSLTAGEPLYHEAVQGDGDRHMWKNMPTILQSTRSVLERILDSNSTRKIVAEKPDFYPSNWDTIRRELSAAGMKNFTFYDIFFDFIALNVIADTENVPTAVKQPLQNRWISVSMKKTTVMFYTWSRIKTKRAYMVGQIIYFMKDMFSFKSHQFDTPDLLAKEIFENLEQRVRLLSSYLDDERKT
ncbi:UNVERIFIED_CONTAM: hypothetical protein FKN15_059906 [Acipenser sinensis]